MSEPAGAARFVPHALLVAMIAIWGGSYAVVKEALEGLPPFAVVALRFWLAVLCLLPFARPGFLHQLFIAHRGGLSAGLFLGTGYLLQTLGMTETSASMGGFLAGLIVLLVAVGGYFLLGARVGPRTLLGLGIGLVGTVLLCWPDDGDLGTDTPRGIALQIASSASYALHILTVSRFGRTLPALAFCLWQLAFTAVTATIAAAVHGDVATVLAADWTPGLVAAVVYLALFATALGIGVQTRVQHRIPPMHVALLFALQPVFAAAFGYGFRGDRLGGLQLAGGTIVVFAVVLTSLDRPRR